jgi:ERCC4-type nuclease
MKLVLDNREHKLIEHFKDTCLIEPLELGDIIIRNDSDDEPVFIIERKTLNDLYSSINDGRHREQKMRLVNNYPKSKIAYLIEGNLNQLQESRYKIVYGAMLNTQLRDNLRIFRTNDLKESCFLIKALLQKLEKNPEWSQTQTESNSSKLDYSDTIKTNKKENMTPEVCHIVQLAQIPGVSHSMSKKILEKYTTLSNLIIAYLNSDPSEGELLLADIPLNDKRKLGKVISQRIYKYLT